MNINIFSQNQSIEIFFKEYGYDCNTFNNEDLYEYYGYDVEDDVTPAIEALNQYCNSLKNIAYVVATNVNIRNRPTKSDDAYRYFNLLVPVPKVLFQLNKVAWYKPDFDSRYLQENWLSYPATPVEIIDSAIADGNTWYKIKGAKLTKEEISDLSKWSNWNIVRDSLFNLDKEGYPIRENNDREHWIYHTLVHRFQNNSFKDGKYSASIVVEDWFKEIGEKVNFTINGDDVKGEFSYSSSLTDGVYCKLYGEKSTNGRHLSLKSTCYSEGDEYEGGDYQITIMDNNAFKLTDLANNNSRIYRYEFEEIENKYLVTNNNFGKINSKTTIDDLFSIFGKDNVRVSDGQSCDGERYRSYYIETEDIEFYIADWSWLPYDGWWEISSSDKKFRTKDGLGAGSNKSEIEKFNGQSIDICWDYDYEQHENNIADCYCDGQVESYNKGVFVEGIGRPWKNGIDFEFNYYEKDVATKIKLYLIK